MGKLISRLIKNQKGQALVETALILPILTIFLMGILQFGLIFQADLIAANLSREAARAAAVGKTDAEVTAIVLAGQDSLGDGDLSVEIAPLETARYRGLPVTVAVNYEVPIIVPFFNLILEDPFPLREETTMRME